ncbi:TetR/AcrR family transcriptional regulator [Rubripirellula obstinata]|uniref:TetR/AcrR family transcriptional regulator n=1 Tax=Rubripirellula obstinata TaxID=406547 RepID=UPI00190FBCC7|nr:TetR/AcrR family transcriptional regulator [Rubripirellula obstinata]
MKKTENELKALSAKAQKKRNNILGNSMRVFAKEGFGGTDVQVIADLAGVGKGTVYRHFGNKEQLFLATAKHCLEMLGQFVLKELGGEQASQQLVQQHGAIETLRQIASAVALFYQRTPQAVEIMIQERAEFRETVFPSHLMHRAENRAGVDELIKAAIDGGEIRVVDPTIATNAYSDLIYGSVISGCLEGGKSKLVARVDAAMEIFLAGLTPENSKSKRKPRNS